MKCSTEAMKKMAEILVKGLEQAGATGRRILGIEMGMWGIAGGGGSQGVGAVFGEAGRKGKEVTSDCGEAMIVSIFGRVEYCCGYQNGIKQNGKFIPGYRVFCLYVGKTSLAVTKYCVPLHQLSECDIRRALGGSRCGFHGFFCTK